MDDLEAAKSLSQELALPLASNENQVLRVEEGQDLERIVPREFALNREILPLFLDGASLALAMADPRDEAAVEVIEAETGLKVTPLVAPAFQLRSAAIKFYGG